MGSFPTGVTVVTVACGDDNIRGVTVNSFSPVSLDPMLALVCLNETSRAFTSTEVAGLGGSAQADALATEQFWTRMITCLNHLTAR